MGGDRPGRHRPAGGGGAVTRARAGGLEGVRAVGLLHGRGAHLVLCGQDKGPLAQSWWLRRPGINQTLAHAARGGLLGLVPSSLGLVVVDVDMGGAVAGREAEAAVGRPLAVVASRRSANLHLYYPSGRGEMNAQWRTASGGGDIRGGWGYVVLWDPRRALRASALARGRVAGGHEADIGAIVDPSLPATNSPNRLSWAGDPRNATLGPPRPAWLGGRRSRRSSRTESPPGGLALAAE